jgi:putative membrane protein
MMRMAIPAILGVLAGLMLVGHYGVAPVANALSVAGWGGLAAVTVFHLLPLGHCALAWRVQLRQPPASIGRYFRFRLTREAGGDLLGMLPASGLILGIRAMVLAGIEASVAAATTVVDSTLEMASQIVFALAGVAILIVEGPGRTPVGWALGGVAVLASLLASFVLVQRVGLLRLLEHLAERLATERARVPLAQAAAIHERIHRIYADRPCVLRAFAVHLAAWVVGAGEAGTALYLLGRPLGLASLLALESLIYALRGAAFFVPAAAGVQEGGYVVLGALFGIGPEAALAVSLLKRGRELLLGAIGLAAWQAAEAARARQSVQIRARATAPQPRAD